jgi:hypothetical protein
MNWVIFKQTAHRHFVFLDDVIRVGSSFLKHSNPAPIVEVEFWLSGPRPVQNCSALCLPLRYTPGSNVRLKYHTENTQATIPRPRWTITLKLTRIGLLTFTKYLLQIGRIESHPSRLNCHAGRTLMLQFGSERMQSKPVMATVLFMPYSTLSEYYVWTKTNFEQALRWMFPVAVCGHRRVQLIWLRWSLRPCLGTALSSLYFDGCIVVVLISTPRKINQIKIAYDITWTLNRWT